MAIASIRQINLSERDRYGNLAIPLQEAVNFAYPEVEFIRRSPGCWGGSPHIFLEGAKTLSIPEGQYKSNAHRHHFDNAVLAVETARDCRLNLAKNPLFLLKGRAWNGDYRSLSFHFVLFGRNEDGSYFCHPVKPSIGETGDLDKCRSWIWQLKNGEKIAARQGDLAFIPKSRPSGKDRDTAIAIGNHSIACDRATATKHKFFALNPRAEHGEHDSIALTGWHELRLGRVWDKGSTDRGD